MGVCASRAAARTWRVASISLSRLAPSGMEASVKPFMKSITTTAGRSPNPIRSPKPRDLKKASISCSDCDMVRVLLSLSGVEVDQGHRQAEPGRGEQQTGLRPGELVDEAAGRVTAEAAAVHGHGHRLGASDAGHQQRQSVALQALLATLHLGHATH